MEETRAEREVTEKANLQADHEPPARKNPNYILVFIVLAVLTGIEIVIAQLPIPRAPILIPLAFIKASLVALYYMHLRSDQKLLSYIFLFGVLVGIALIISFMVLILASQGQGPRT